MTNRCPEVLELDRASSRTAVVVDDIDDPQGDILTGLGFLLVFGFLAIGAAVATGSIAFDEPEHVSVLAKIEADARERKALRPDQLSHPLGPCDLTLKEMVGPVVLRSECYRRPQK